ncbi:50S ribosomal protein 6, chloroplastic-like [Chenopodium quinoa]|uniref:50S ribosomal protein 6, chloroplastic n=1 Tax=Chenopodium quinoa TaxID=63459 RepID=A0A803MTH3_CHEQI|nr:50S ribosomal protein 6, chloroplastic-like [Chenopodium quinoa]
MSVSAIFGTRIAAIPSSGGVGGGNAVKLQPSNGGVMIIECSSRPQKKGTAHHMKTRPKKTAAWELRRRPAVYPPLPPLPAEWTIVSSASEEVDSSSSTATTSTETQTQ